MVVVEVSWCINIINFILEYTTQVKADQLVVEEVSWCINIINFILEYTTQVKAEQFVVEEVSWCTYKYHQLHTRIYHSI